MFNFNYITTLYGSCLGLVLVDTAQHPSVEINRAGFGVRMYAVDDYFVSWSLIFRWELMAVLNCCLSSIDVIDFGSWFQSITVLGRNDCLWPCAIRSCHNRDMPKISSEYAFAHLQWHNLKSEHPTIVKVYIFGKLFLQGIQKWLYFCGRVKSKNIMADQKLKFW